VQILDENGEVIQSYYTPEESPHHYTPADLLDISGIMQGTYSIFPGSIRSVNQTWTYLVGLPVPVTRVTSFVNRDRYDTLKPVVWVILAVALALLILSTLVYGGIVTRQMDRIRTSIREIATRTFTPTSGEGAFRDLYIELNALNREIQTSDDVRAKTDQFREEWIANITHDLKTPLSPIRGYAELLADQDAKIETGEIHQYGEIIVKNAAYAEQLIDDLKLTFQLKNDLLVLHRQNQNLVRFTRELIIDLLNDPEYSQREISFFSPDDTILYSFDPVFLKRAFNNILTNALVHNNAGTEISVTIQVHGNIHISIQDNGQGMNQDELDQLFIRYYRGNNMAAKPEGTGLGMAIARQIIEQHGGNIRAESQAGSGTCVSIEFPLNQNEEIRG
jgi:signal transduction histidine kinase